MIFAAGKGTRLQPLTNTMPKALVSVGEVTLLERTIRKLIAAGCREIIVNVHHFAEQIIDFIEQKQHFGIHIEISDEAEELLETGGGLAKAAHFFDDGKPFIVHNVDIISTINLQALYQMHTTSGASATLAVSNRPTSRYLLFDRHNRLQGWLNEATGEQKPSEKELYIDALSKRAFAGIQVISAKLLRELEKRSGKFSIIDFYLDQIERHRIECAIQNNETIIDVGKIAAFSEANDFIHLSFG